MSNSPQGLESAQLGTDKLYNSVQTFYCRVKYDRKRLMPATTKDAGVHKLCCLHLAHNHIKYESLNIFLSYNVQRMLHVSLHEYIPKGTILQRPPHLLLQRRGQYDKSVYVGILNSVFSDEAELAILKVQPRLPPATTIKIS